VSKQQPADQSTCVNICIINNDPSFVNNKNLMELSSFDSDIN